MPFCSLTIRPVVPATANWRAAGRVRPYARVVVDESAIQRWKGGRAWRLGTAGDVAWIAEHTPPGFAITSAIPPVFEVYATVVVPGPVEDYPQHERAVLRVLAERSADQPWWLGYLDTGADDVVFPDAARVTLYAGWPYVLVDAGAEQAATWRSSESWRGGLPDLIFPADRSWLLSTLWDDDWRCLGGPAAMVEEFLREPGLVARTVQLGEDATPPGHVTR